MDLFYRFNQFVFALWEKPKLQDLEQVKEILDPKLYILFLRLQTSEQAHSIRVMHRLMNEMPLSTELLKAGLMHDIGKVHYPLKLWERVWIVLGKPYFQKQISRLHHVLPQDLAGISFLMRPFQVAFNHPFWGAKILEERGCDPLTIWLVEHHHDLMDYKEENIPYNLLASLQKSDYAN